MLPALFYVNSLYFQQWNSDWDIQYCDFWMWVLGCTNFLIDKKIESWDLLMLL